MGFRSLSGRLAGRAGRVPPSAAVNQWPMVMKIIIDVNRDKRWWRGAGHPESRSRAERNMKVRGSDA